MTMTTTKYTDFVPSTIIDYWNNQYPFGVVYYESGNWIIVIANSLSYDFIPGGDKLAIINKSTGRAIYCWNNETSNSLTQHQYIKRIQGQTCKSQ